MEEKGEKRQKETTGQPMKSIGHYSIPYFKDVSGMVSFIHYKIKEPILDQYDCSKPRLYHILQQPKYAIKDSNLAHMLI